MITIVRWVTLSIFLAVIAAPASAGLVRKADDSARDQAQTMKARGLLFQDPALAAFNIGVIVQDRIAILWGPVPSAEVAFRAEMCLRGMAELREVRNELMVHEAIQPIRGPAEIEPLPKTPPRVLPELLPPELPPDVRATVGAPGVLTGASTGTKASGPSTEVEPVNALAKPADTSRVSGGQDLATGIRVLLLSKNTYQSVQFRVQGRRVYLQATQPQQSDVLQEVARVIARLPNVEGVIVLDHAGKNSPD